MSRDTKPWHTKLAIHWWLDGQQGLMNNSVLFDRLAKSAGFLKALNNVLLSSLTIVSCYLNKRAWWLLSTVCMLFLILMLSWWRTSACFLTTLPNRKRLVLLKQENIKFWSWMSPQGIALKQVCIHSVAWRNLRSMLCDHSRQLSVWIGQHLQSCLFFNMYLVLLQEKLKELTALWPCWSDCFLWTNFTLDTLGEARNGHQQWNPAYTAIVSTCVFTQVWREEVLQNAFCELQNRLGTHLLCLGISMSLKWHTCLVYLSGGSVFTRGFDKHLAIIVGNWGSPNRQNITEKSLKWHISRPCRCEGRKRTAGYVEK